MEFIDKIEGAFIRFGKQLFRDEKNAAIFSFTITLLVYWLIWLIWGTEVPWVIFAIALPLAGPLFEKPFLFLAYFLQAKRMWRENEKSIKYWDCFKTVWREEDAGRILKADIFYHDTLSWAFMLIFTFFLPDLEVEFNFYAFITTGVGALGLVYAGITGGGSFALAVVGAAIIEVKMTAKSFDRFQRKLVDKLGFSKPESYIEMLYVGLSDMIRPEKINLLKSKWHLIKSGQARHSEEEIKNHRLKRYNNWRPSLQIRRSTETGISIQVIYEEPIKIKTEDTNAFRCFAVKKLKWKIAVDSLSKEETKKILTALGFIRDDVDIFSVEYERNYLYNPVDLSVSFDNSLDKKIFWIETKLWPHVFKDDFYRELNEFICIFFPVHPATKRKSVTMEALAQKRLQFKM